MTELILGTRGSELALTQTEMTKAVLARESSGWDSSGLSSHNSALLLHVIVRDAAAFLPAAS